MKSKGIKESGSGVLSRAFASVKWFLYDLKCRLHHFLFKNKKNTQGSVKGRRIQKSIFLVLLLAYPVLHFLVFFVYVNFNSILMGFRDTATQEFSLVHFQRFFKEIFQEDTFVHNSFLNTLWFFVSGNLIGIPLSLFFSYALFKKVFLHKVFRIIFFLPSIISMVVLATLYKYLLNSDGPVNIILMNLNLIDQPIYFLSDSRTALVSVLFYSVWFGLGTNIVLFSGAMARIPQEIFEVAKLEGVGFLREFVKIVIPLVWSTISSVFVLGTIGMFTALGPVLLLIESRTMMDVSTIAYFIYYSVSQSSNSEYAAAVGLVFTCIGLPIVLFVRWGMGKVFEDVAF